MSNQRDLALAYSPGVAVPCLEIQKDPLTAYDYTAKGNLVAVISNGTAVLGLGNIGALAGKPVMEGKGCLFKKFAGIDVFDIEIDETDPDKLVEIIASLEPTFGGINLEDIKAPECFEIETKLRERMKIPVFHDDQHGTAIVAAAACSTRWRWSASGSRTSSWSARAPVRRPSPASNIVVGLGVRRENIWVTDSKGVVYQGRTESMDEQKARYAQATRPARWPTSSRVPTCSSACRRRACSSPRWWQDGARGRSSWPWPTPTRRSGPSSPRRCARTASSPPAARDYPNQVNNVLCFPFIFRGALDVGATTINEEMKLACVRAIAELAGPTSRTWWPRPTAGRTSSSGPST